MSSDALAKIVRYKEDDEANSKELGEEDDAVDCCLQQADGLRLLLNISLPIICIWVFEDAAAPPVTITERIVFVNIDNIILVFVLIIVVVGDESIAR